MRLAELPLLKRELVGLLRTRKAFWIVLLVLFLSSLIPLLNWPSSHAALRSGFENIYVFSAFFFAQLTTALFIVPAFTAGAISGERERDTYDALYSTLLRPSSVVLSKVVASTGYILFVLAFASPTAFVLYFLGGFRLESIFRCYLILAAALVTAGIVCIYHSMRSKRTAHAAVRGYFWVFFWSGGLTILLSILLALIEVTLGRNAILTGWASDLRMACACTSPYVLVGLEIFAGGRLQGPNLQPYLEPWALYLCYAGLVSLVHFILLLRLSRTPDLSRPRWLERREARKAVAATKPIVRSVLTQWLIRQSEREVPVFANALFQKEIRAEFFGRLLYRRATFWLPLMIFTAIFAVACANESPPNATLGFVSFAALTLIFLRVPAVGASGFPREREQGNLDFLRSTRLTFSEILTGKFWAAVYSGLGILAAAAWALPISAAVATITLPERAYRNGYFGSDGSVPGSVLTCFAVVCVSLVFSAALSTAVSTFSRRSLPALLVSYVLLLGILILWPIFLGLSGMHRGAEYLLGATHPYVAVGMTAFGSGSEAAGSVIGFFACYFVAIFLLWLVARGQVETAHARDS